MATVSDLNNVLFSGNYQADSLLDAITANWNYLLPSRTTLYYTFDCGVGSVIDDATSEALTAFNATQKATAASILSYVGSVVGLSFVETRAGTSADFHFGSIDISGASTSGLCRTLSSYSYTGGQVLTAYRAEAFVYLDNNEFSSSNNSPTTGSSGYETLLHEIGHALGLDHPFEGTYSLPSNEDNTNNTVMSYTRVGANKTTFQAYDLLALNWIYGKDGLGGSYGYNSTFGPTLSPGSSDVTGPSVESFSPVDEASNVAVGSNIVLTFNETIARGTGSIVLKTAAGVTVATYDAASGSNLTLSGSTLTVNPTADLAFGTGYKLEFGAGSIKDSAGNSYAGTMSYNFTTGSNAIIGSTGDDTLTGGAGIPIDGLAGIDTVSYTGNHSTVTHNANDTWTVGTDTLSNIERLQFADKKIAIDLTPDGNAGKSLQFIGMLVYSMVSTPNIVGTILSIFDQGKSMKEVCQLAIDVGLTRDLAGSNSNLDLAKLVFRNVVGSEASAENAVSLASYIQGNGGSMTQGDFLATVAQLDLNNQHIGLVGLQQTGIEYIL
jgi:methionine-rich copper-binding protein CopC